MPTDRREGSYVMANARRCTVHPQHVMVKREYSLPHYAFVFRCDCGEWAIGSTDESRHYLADRGDQ